jgi:protein-tyrosine phosphatase
MVNTENVLCTGNICRSPIAEIMLAEKLRSDPRVIVRSGGIAAPMGVPPDPEARRAAAALGYIVQPDQRSRQVSAVDLNLATVILVMEPVHKQYVRRLSMANANKTFLLGQWTCGAIPDPIGRDAAFFDAVTKSMEEAAGVWAPKIIALSH